MVLNYIGTHFAQAKLASLTIILMATPIIFSHKKKSTPQYYSPIHITAREEGVGGYQRAAAKAYAEGDMGHAVRT